MNSPPPPAPQGRLRALLTWLPRAWAEIDAELEPGRRFGHREAISLVVAALGLAVMWFGGSEMTYLRWTAPLLGTRPDGTLDGVSAYYELFGLLHWVAFCVIGYVGIPALWIKLSGGRVSECYTGFGGTWRHLHVYGALFLPVFVTVLIVSGTPAFQAIYPMYSQSSRSWLDLVAWEVGYGVQFFALEFFFRGYLLRSLRPVLGYGAVFVMVVPYCMVHFNGKTFAESVGAILAGTVLGTMAMRWRSIWGGVLLHWMVAITMDIASMVQKGDFPPSHLF
jgi:membrane protease YdiL (CAAX protease family)